jgi:DNA-binding FadR family transcriptional regulator
MTELVEERRTLTEDLPVETTAAVLQPELQAARGSASGRLPAERELAARYGLSRTAVRRWLDDLERSGAVTRHVGRGTFVTPAPAEEGDTSPAEIMAVRLLLEPQLLGLAVAHATPADIAQMRTCLRQSEAAGSFEEFEHWDSRLHTTIAEASHNGLLIRLFTVMNESRTHPLWGSAKRRSFTEQRRREYEGDHRDLVDALDDRDAAAAAVVMRRHLTRIRSALLGTDA